MIMKTFIMGQKTSETLRLQTFLGIPEPDGIFGRDTIVALFEYEKRQFRPITVTIDERLEALVFPETKRRKSMNSQWLSGLVATTGFKYIVAMIATFVASKLGLEAGSVEGIITQLIGVAAMVWGMWESARSKVVVDGVRVPLKNMPVEDKVAAKNLVDHNTMT